MRLCCSGEDHANIEVDTADHHTAPVFQLQHSKSRMLFRFGREKKQTYSRFGQPLLLFIGWRVNKRHRLHDRVLYFIILANIIQWTQCLFLSSYSYSLQFKANEKTISQTQVTTREVSQVNPYVNWFYEKVLSSSPGQPLWSPIFGGWLVKHWFIGD